MQGIHDWQALSNMGTFWLLVFIAFALVAIIGVGFWYAHQK